MEAGKIRPVDYQSNAAQVGMLQNLALKGKGTDAKEVQHRGTQGALQTGDLGRAEKAVSGRRVTGTRTGAAFTPGYHF